MGLPSEEMRVTSYMINILYFVFYRYGRITIFYTHDEILLFQYYLEGVRSENKINVSFEKEKNRFAVGYFCGAPRNPSHPLRPDLSLPKVGRLVSLVSMVPPWKCSTNFNLIYGELAMWNVEIIRHSENKSSKAELRSSQNSSLEFTISSVSSSGAGSG